MMKMILRATVLSTLGFLATTSAFGQLEKVSAVYNKYKTLQADFTFEYFRDNQDLAGQAERGTLLLDQRNGKYRISTPGQELISDGNTQWIVLHEAAEVQVTETGAHNGSITPLNVFTFFNKGYAVKQLGSEKIGSSTLTLLELTPEDARKTYSKIQLRIHPVSNQIHDVTVFDKNKSRYRYTILNLKGDREIPSEKFVFSPEEFPDFEVVDLR